VSLLWNLALHAAARIKLRSRDVRPLDFTPPISVLKPLCGVDEGLYENLVSFATQDYPSFELVFGVEDPRDPALRVVWKLRRAYPEVAMRVVVGPSGPSAHNPKVRNLLRILRVAAHEYVLISDSNVVATPDYLRDVARDMADPTVGLVSNPIVGIGERSVGAALESFHLNTLVIGSVSLADACRQPCVIGKSMLMRRSELARLGGLEAVRDILAEDYVLGRTYHEAGYRVVLRSEPVRTRNVTLPTQRFLSRHLRWAQLRRHAAPRVYAAEVLAYLTPWLCALVVVAEGTPYFERCLGGALTACLVRLASDVGLARMVAGEWPPLRAVLLSPLKDCVMATLWVLGLFKRSVAWRGHPMRIGAGSRVAPSERDMLLPGVRSREA
jgi:ceramide glucosyltransferase